MQQNNQKCYQVRLPFSSDASLQLFIRLTNNDHVSALATEEA